MRAPGELFWPSLPRVLSHHCIPVSVKGSKAAAARAPIAYLGFGVRNIAVFWHFEVFPAAKQCFSLKDQIGQEKKTVLCPQLHLLWTAPPERRGFPLRKGSSPLFPNQNSQIATSPLAYACTNSKHPKTGHRLHFQGPMPAPKLISSDQEPRAASPRALHGDRNPIELFCPHRTHFI